MIVGEATRQYQCALEKYRTVRGACEGLLSFEREVEQAALAVADAQAEMDKAWLRDTRA